MAVLGIDYGTKRIGVAVSDGTLSLARPLPFLDAASPAKLAPLLKALAGREGIDRAVVGLPRNLDGTYGPAAENVRAFVAALEKLLPFPVETIDERLSTVQASRQLREAGHDSRAQRGKIDSAAATVILQAYLDRRAIREGRDPLGL